MKKLTIVAVAMTLITGMAFASSLAIPWFVDFAPHDGSIPPTSGVASFLYLKNNTSEPMTARIEYFTGTGTPVGPGAAESGGPGNSFTINALASIGARLGGTDDIQEASPGGRDVPNRPLEGAGNDGKKNGSAVITWVGGSGDIQGQLTTWDSSGRAANGLNAVFGYAHLLPVGN